MVSLETIALNYNPSKFSTKAMLDRTDSKQFFINNGTYESPNYVNVNEGITTHKFTTNETWNAISGLSTETLHLVVIQPELVTNGITEISIDGTVTKQFINGAARALEIVAPSSSIDVITRTAYDSRTIPTARTLTKDVSAQDLSMHGLKFNQAGTKMATVGAVSDNFHSWTLSTPYAPSSAGSAMSSASIGNNHYDIEVSDLGDKVILLRSSTNED